MEGARWLWVKSKDSKVSRFSTFLCSYRLRALAAGSSWAALMQPSSLAPCLTTLMENLELLFFLVAE
jgi:hypothetical protein